MAEPAPSPHTPSSEKSAQAFRTITEVAAQLDVAQHVLRFWETKFSQISPMKRGGGRRYYRPEDVALLKRIRDLLYLDGYTIKGVKQLLQRGEESDSEIERRQGRVEQSRTEDLHAVLGELKDLRNLLKNL